MIYEKEIIVGEINGFPLKAIVSEKEPQDKTMIWIQGNPKDF